MSVLICRDGVWLIPSLEPRAGRRPDVAVSLLHWAATQSRVGWPGLPASLPEASGTLMLMPVLFRGCLFFQRQESIRHARLSSGPPAP